MCVSPSWVDIGGQWDTGSPAVPPEPEPTWEQDSCGIGFATEVMVIIDEGESGFLLEGVVEEFNDLSDTVQPFVNNWDTCEPPLDSTWVEDEPFNGTPGDCDE